MPMLDALFDDAVSWKNWRDLSDHDLLELDLVADEPENLTGLIQEVREGEMPIPEFDYNMKEREEYVRCAFCRKPNHYIGLVARYPDGARILVGRICAGKHLGATFKTTLKDFDAALARQTLVKRQKAVAAYCGELHGDLRALIQHPAVQTLQHTRKTMRELLGPLWPELSRAAEQGMEIKVERQVPDFAGAQKLADTSGLILGKQRREFFKEKARTLPMKTVLEGSGFIEGASFFARGLSIETILHEQKEQLRLANSNICGRDVPTKELTAAFAKFSEIRDVLSIEFQKLKDLPMALSQDNLKRIADWLNDKSKQRYAQGMDDTYECRSFYATDGVFGERGRYHWTVSLPSAYHVPAPEILATLTAALAETGY